MEGVEEEEEGEEEEGVKEEDEEERVEGAVGMRGMVVGEAEMSGKDEGKLACDFIDGNRFQSSASA